ncbi:MAG: amidohydrolase [Acidobacteriia bacterium]|nr:amidohydrolase [Terriglobia bacterium]
MPFIVALLAALSCAAQTADLVVIHANIYTGERSRPRAKALAVQGGKILAVGDDLGRHVGASTKTIDAKGATVVPGFIDSHGHMRGLGESLENLDFRSSKSSGAVAAMVAKEAARRKPGEWILGRSWDQTQWPGSEFPNADELSRGAPNNPVFLTRVDGHAAWVNRKALEMADIQTATPDPAGGRIIRESSGRPSGVLIDRAQELVRRRIPALTRGQIQARLVRAAAECARLGLTSVHDAGISAEDLAAYRELVLSNRLPVHVYAMIRGEGSLWEEYLRRGPEVGEWLTVRSIKLMADGALGSRGAAMKDPYTDEAGNRGLLLLRKEDIARVGKAAVKAGLQVNTHAIGDRGNRTVLEAYAEALGGKNDHRFRVEHAQIVSVTDMPMFQQYSVIASMQATHATSDMRWAHLRVGPQRIGGAYAWRKYLDLGVTVANGSDFPVESANPLWGFYAAVTRQDQQGSPAGGWMPEHRMSREEALRSWTLSGAYAGFEEKMKGTLAPGKGADFVLLTQDIMTIAPAEILRARVRMTVAGGRVVYEENP